MIPSRMKASILVFAFVSYSSGFAEAQELLRPGDGMDYTLFKPAVDTKGHFTVDASPVLPHLGFSVGLMLDFGFDHWMAVEQISNELVYDRTMMDKSIHGVFMGNVGLFNRFVLGLQIPIAYASGTGYDGVDPINGEQLSRGWSTNGAFGDLVLHAKASLLRADRNPLGIAAIVAYQVGSGQSEILLGEAGNSGSFLGRFVIDTQPSDWYRVALNLGARIPFGAKKGNTIDPVYNGGAGYVLFDYGTMLSAGIGQSIAISPGKFDFVVEAYGNQLASRMGDLPYMSVEANGGFKLYVDGNSYLMAGAAGGLPISDTPSGYGFQNAVWRLFLGFTYEPSIQDRDLDGIPDDDDNCPDDPEDLDDFEDSDGCPDPDNDRDGILDVEDDCPMIAEDLDGDDDWDGCPEKDEPEAPEALPDTDNDGIPDMQDECPREKEVLNGLEDEDGCPDEGEALINLTEDQLELLKGVQFKTASDEIVGQHSFDILDAVVSVLKMNPQMRIRVEGHTDARGKRQYNIGLSNRRARSVKRYLVEHGIAPKRLTSRGYGPDKPIESNETDEGRAANRRVVFTILKR